MEKNLPMRLKFQAQVRVSEMLWTGFWQDSTRTVATLKKWLSRLGRLFLSLKSSFLREHLISRRRGYLRDGLWSNGPTMGTSGSRGGRVRRRRKFRKVLPK